MGEKASIGTYEIVGGPTDGEWYEFMCDQPLVGGIPPTKVKMKHEGRSFVYERELHVDSGRFVYVFKGLAEE